MLFIGPVISNPQHCLLSLYYLILYLTVFDVASETYRASSTLINAKFVYPRVDRVSPHMNRTLDMTYEIDDPGETPPSFKRTLPYRELRFLAACEASA